MRLTLTPEMLEGVKQAAEAAGTDATAWVREQIANGLLTAPLKAPTPDELLAEAQALIARARAMQSKRKR